MNCKKFIKMLPFHFAVSMIAMATNIVIGFIMLQNETFRAYINAHLFKGGMLVIVVSSVILGTVLYLLSKELFKNKEK